MEAHENAFKKILTKASQKLQLRISKSKKQKKEPPLEAIVLARTEAFVYFGTKEQRDQARKKWTDQMGQGMPRQTHMDLRRFGKSEMISLQEGSEFVLGAELHVIHDTADVTIDKSVREQLIQEAKQCSKSSQPSM